MGSGRGRQGPDWQARKAEIEAMVAAGLSDVAIGLHYDVNSTRICTVRKLLGIASLRRPGKQPFAKTTGKPAREASETYTDEHGRTVTICPVRYAEGGGKQPFTARPRRST